MSKNQQIGYLTKCQICSQKGLQTILSLGHQPIVQEYLTAEGLHKPEITYPLNICLCPGCGLLQLDYIVEPKKVFPLAYPYRTGLTKMLIENFKSLTGALTEKYHLGAKDLAVDIGSNDGTLLQGFKDKGVRVLGVEPTGAAKVANKNGIPTLQNFFNKQVVQKILKKYGPARVVTATNVFAHINNVPELMKNIKNLLADDGVFVSESQYLMDIVEKLEFDTIYHEHLRFYGLQPLMALFAKNGMSAVDAERISAAGGSIRVYAIKGKHPQSARLKKLLDAEKKAGIYDKKTLQNFAEKIITAKNELMALLLQCKKGGGRIVGLGSPARSNTLLGFTKINEHLLDYACEKNGSPKIGLFTPGSHIPVVDEKRILEDQPEFVLILSWHIGKELAQKIKMMGFKGKFIIPLPRPQII